MAIFSLLVQFHPRFASQFKALILGMKKYSPPRSTLNVWMPWMRRLTGVLRNREGRAFLLQPDDRIAFVAGPMKSPSLIHSCCRNSMVAIALALMNRKIGAARHFVVCFGQRVRVVRRSIGRAAPDEAMDVDVGEHG